MQVSSAICLYSWVMFGLWRTRIDYNFDIFFIIISIFFFSLIDSLSNIQTYTNAHLSNDNYYHKSFINSSMFYPAKTDQILTIEVIWNFLIIFKRKLKNTISNSKRLGRMYFRICFKQWLYIYIFIIRWLKYGENLLFIL